MPFMDARDGTSLFYNDWGTGKPVVLVHVWPLNSDMWEYNARVLAEGGHRVIAYDRRGFGRSGQPFTGYDYDTMADDLGVVIETLGLQNVALVGFSMGGGEVARYLGRGGAGVSRAVLISAVTPYLLKNDSNPGGVDRSTFDAMVEGLQKDRPGFLADFGKAFFGAGLLNFSVSSEILQWALWMAMQASPKATLDCVRAFSETDFRADCAAIRVPALVIHGDADQTVPIEKSGKLAAELIPGATLSVYEGEPHALMYTARDRLNDEMARFMA